MRRLVAVVLMALSGGGLAAQTSRTLDRNTGMSGMGALAREAIQSVQKGLGVQAKPLPGTGDCTDGNTRCVPIGPIPSGTQAEVSIAVDSTGQNIVVGFNDFRGFGKNPLSLSGYMYSNNGGQTFIDGGQLPSPGNVTIGTSRYPLIFGDPDVKYLGGCNFIYASIIVTANAQSGLNQTLGIHRSTDCGKTWTGPIEITPATNPGGAVDVGFDALDAADKELMDVDPDTGRVLIGWANFTGTAPFLIEMSSTFSDNILSANPTFAPRRVVSATARDGQGASVQFAGGGSPNAYIAWARSGTAGSTGRIAFARSTDNGATWSAPTEITGNFLMMDEVLGNDRVNVFPSLGVDNSRGAFKGNVYAVYSNNNSLDGADVVFRRSTDEGLTFGPSVLINDSESAKQESTGFTLCANMAQGSRMLDISKDIHSLSDFRRHTSQFVQALKKSGRPVVLTLNGRAEMVIQDAAAYQKLLNAARELELLRAAKKDVSPRPKARR